ncbi:MAG: hypothetical protein U0324_05730 [Polyangiales bacterium]
MRWSSIFAASSLLLAACDDAPSPAPDVAAPDVAAPDVAADLPDDLAADAAPDATVDDAAVDVAADAPCVLDLGAPDTSGARFGFIRFAHMGRGMGPVRFVARSLSMFAPAYVEAVVPEGTATLQIQTLPVGYEIHVTSAGDAAVDAVGDVVVDGAADGGVLTDGSAAPQSICTAVREPGDLVDPICGDVYFFAGCSVLLVGSPEGDPIRFTHRHLQRVSDLPQRTAECDTGYVRTAQYYAFGPPLDTDTAAGRPLSRNATYRETGGIRAVPAGPLRVVVREADGGVPFGELPAGVIAPGHTHTLYLWGDQRSPAMPGVSALLLDDVSPTFR